MRCGVTLKITNFLLVKEMELIYDLRGHMEQLYQEMSELRKSIKCCMDMQLMLQQSIKQEVVGGKSCLPLVIYCNWLIFFFLYEISRFIENCRGKG